MNRVIIVRVWVIYNIKSPTLQRKTILPNPEAQKFSKELQKNYLPNVIFQISNKSSDLPLIKDRYVKDKTLIYVCKDKVCLKPSETPSEALKQIKNTF